MNRTHTIPAPAVSSTREAGPAPGGVADEPGADERSAPPRHRARPAPLVSVVIPTRHEARTIGAFLYRALAALDGLDAEIVVVDDSDRDNTVEVLRRLREELAGRLVVIHRPKGSVPDRTLGTAVVTGIRAARGAYVCVMDADGQHPPEAVRGMLETARRTGAEYVGGSRYLPGGSAAGLDGPARKAISRGLALAARAAFAGTPVRRLTDPLSGFFLFRRSLADGVALRPVGWKISLEVLVRGRVRRAAEVPYAFARRADGESKATLGQGLLVLRHMVGLLLGLAGPRRCLAFGAVGLSGLLVNTGTLLALAAAGFPALGWPIWTAAELSILWNYHLHRRLTWRDRPRGTWWAYNLAAALASLVAIGATTGLVRLAAAPLGIASVAGVLAGAALNFGLADVAVFARTRQAQGGAA